MITVIIPVHNRKKFTQACLRSLRNQTVQADRIVVVDDGSTDGTPEMLSEEFPSVHVLSGNGNLFWSASVNKGIEYALKLGVRYVMTLNNDTFASADFLENMLKGTKTYPNALLGAFEIDAISGMPNYGGEIINWKSSTSAFLLKDKNIAASNGLHEVSLFPGRGLLIPRIVFETIGLFDEKKLPHYLADYDFTMRAKRKGFKVYCNYDAKIYTYPEESGERQIRKRKTLRNYFNHLFGIKGGGNLVDFTIFTWRNCPTKYILPSLFTGYLRRIGGYWLK
jgi:GT2 family glycosyltransferase